MRQCETVSEHSRNFLGTIFFLISFRFHFGLIFLFFSEAIFSFLGFRRFFLPGGSITEKPQNPWMLVTCQSSETRKMTNFRAILK